MTYHPFLRSLQNESGSSLWEMGGLALFNGVMIQSRTGYAIAVRLPGKGIFIRQVPNAVVPAVFFLPFLRGIAVFLLMTLRAVDAFFFSIFLDSHRIPVSGLKTFELPKKLQQQKIAFVLYSLLSFFFLFVVLSRLGTSVWLEPGFWQSMVSLGLKIGFVFFYALVLNLFSDVRQLFQYHGAEHRAIWALQEGKRLEVDLAQAFSIRHPRCGTVFLLFFFFAQEVVWLILHAFPYAWVWPFQEVVATLVALSFAYEWFRLSTSPRSKLGKKADPLARLLLRVGLALQELTTRAPRDEQVEVALVALSAALALDSSQTTPQNWVVHGLHK